MMLFLIWKSLLHRKLSAAAIVFSIAMGVSIVFAAVSLYQGVASGMQLSKERMGADLVLVPLGVTMEPSLVLFGGATENTYMPADTVEAIRAIPGIKRATPQFFTHALTADCHDIGNDNRMLGYDPESDWIITPWLKQAHKSQLNDDEMILGAKVPIWDGDQLSVLGKWYRIVAIAEETGTTLDYSLFVSMNEARRVVAKRGSLQAVWVKQGPPELLVSTILVQVEDGADLEKLLADIRQTALVQPIVAAEVKKKIQAQFTALVYLLGGLGGLVALLSLFHLFSRFYTLTWERQAEWGLYLALGASGRDIAAIVAGEALAVSLGGSLLGLCLGGLWYKGSLTLLTAYQAFPFVPPSWSFFLLTAGVLVGVFTALGALAAWLPAYNGSKIEPSAVMTRGEFD
nr:ABC transporter permease [uncultured Anaeromusa sp.]